MPLMHGKSKKAFAHNVEAEMHAGKPQDQSLAIAYATKRKAQKHKMAHGGHVEEQKSGYAAEPVPEMEAGDGYEDETEIGTDDMKDADMIARIMHKRKMYSHGGVVANDVGEGEEADKLPNEFDDLVLDDHLEQHEHASDEIGDERVHDDPIDRIMMKHKKDKLPRPA